MLVGPFTMLKRPLVNLLQKKAVIILLNKQLMYQNLSKQVVLHHFTGPACTVNRRLLMSGLVDVVGTPAVQARYFGPLLTHDLDLALKFKRWNSIRVAWNARSTHQSYASATRGERERERERLRAH